MTASIISPESATVATTASTASATAACLDLVEVRHMWSARVCNVSIIRLLEKWKGLRLIFIQQKKEDRKNVCGHYVHVHLHQRPLLYI